MSIKIKETLSKIFRIVMLIISILIFIALIRWAGAKGIISFLVGMGLMAYLLLSNNVMIRSLVKMFGSEENIKEIMKK